MALTHTGLEGEVEAGRRRQEEKATASTGEPRGLRPGLSCPPVGLGRQGLKDDLGGWELGWTEGSHQRALGVPWGRVSFSLLSPHPEGFMLSPWEWCLRRAYANRVCIIFCQPSYIRR